MQVSPRCYADVCAIIDVTGESTSHIQRLSDAPIAVIAGRAHSLPQEEPDLQPDNSDYQLDNLALQLGKSNSQPGNFKS